MVIMKIIMLKKHRFATRATHSYSYSMSITHTHSSSYNYHDNHDNTNIKIDDEYGGFEDYHVEWTQVCNQSYEVERGSQFSLAQGFTTKHWAVRLGWWGPWGLRDFYLVDHPTQIICIWIFIFWVGGGLLCIADKTDNDGDADDKNDGSRVQRELCP